MWLKSIFPIYFYKSLCPLAAALSLTKISHNWEYIQISFNFYIGSIALSRSASLPFLRRSDFRYRSHFLSLFLSLDSLNSLFGLCYSWTVFAWICVCFRCFYFQNCRFEFWLFCINKLMVTFPHHYHFLFFLLSLFLWMVKALIY